MIPMWSSEREMMRICANQLAQWASELSACQQIALREFAREISDLELRMRQFDAKATSVQVPPDKIEKCEFKW